MIKKGIKMRNHTPEFIIIHHSLTKDGRTVSWSAIRKYHMDKKYRDIGYHFGIEKVNDYYEILFGRMVGEEGAHCRQLGMNRRSIGICCVGNYDKYSVPQEQWDLALKLCSWLIDMYNIPFSHVLGHRDFATYKSCPGIN